VPNQPNQSTKDSFTTIRRGVSTANDSALAAAELQESIWQPNIALAVFFCSSEYDREVLAKSLKSCFGDTLLIGCTTAGEITPLGYQTGSLTGFSLAAPDFVMATRVISDLTNFSITDGRATAHALIQELADAEQNPNGDNTFAFLLIDGMSMKQEIVTNALHSGLRDITLFGGSAGTTPGDPATMKTYLYHDGEFHNDRAILTLVNTTRPFVVFKTENYIPTDTKMVITEAQPAIRKVNAINCEPAALEYARLIGAQTDTEIYAMSAAHPVGVCIGRQLYLRAIGWVDHDQSITFLCAIDEGAILTLGKEVDFIQNLRQQFDQVRVQIGEPELVFTCDCFARLLEIEHKGIKDQASDIMVANNAVGFNTYGEQFNSMHINQTLTGVAIGKAKHR
jgi:hypothetical protein